MRVLGSTDALGRCYQNIPHSCGQSGGGGGGWCHTGVCQNMGLDKISIGRSSYSRPIVKK